MLIEVSLEQQTCANEQQEEDTCFALFQQRYQEHQARFLLSQQRYQEHQQKMEDFRYKRLNFAYQLFSYECHCRRLQARCDELRWRLL